MLMLYQIFFKSVIIIGLLLEIMFIWERFLYKNTSLFFSEEKLSKLAIGVNIYLGGIFSLIFRKETRYLALVLFLLSFFPSKIKNLHFVLITDIISIVLLISLWRIL